MATNITNTQARSFAAKNTKKTAEKKSKNTEEAEPAAEA